MKRIILFVLILFTIKSAYSQTNKEVDSIWLLVNSLEGKEQINEMVMLCEALWNVDFDSALHIGELALAKSKEIDYEEGYVFALGDIAGTYFKKGNYAQSLNYYNQSLIYFEKNNRADKQAIIYSNIGNVYFTIGNSELALENYLKTMTIYEELNDTAGIAQSYNNIAFLYKSRDQFEEALKYYDKALELARIIDDKLSMSYILNNVGILYSNIGDKGKALETYLESLSIKEGIQDGPMSKVISLNNIGLIYLNFKDYQLAEQYFIEAYNIASKHNNPYYNASIGLNLSELKKEENLLAESFNYLISSYKFALEAKTRPLIIEACERLSVYYEKEENWKLSNKYLNELILHNDTLRSEEDSKNIVEMQVKFDTDRVNQELVLLHKQKEIDDLRSEKTRNLNLILIISIIFLVLASMLVYSRYLLRQRTSKILEQKNQELELANSTKDRFFAIVAHDLKNHLIAFMNISQLLSEKFTTIPDTKKQHLIERISKSSSSLYKLMDNLLKWALSQTNRIQFNPGEYDLAILVERTILAYAVLAERKDITIKSGIKENSFVFADKNMLETILRNLISNAIKYTKNKGEIKFDAKSEEGYFVVEVSDNGIGMTKDKVDKLFDINTSQSSVRTSHESGTGLGLILVKEFVEKQGGELVVESELDIGSKFIFTVPLKD